MSENPRPRRSSILKVADETTVSREVRNKRVSFHTLRTVKTYDTAATEVSYTPRQEPVQPDRYLLYDNEGKGIPVFKVTDDFDTTAAVLSAPADDFKWDADAPAPSASAADMTNVLLGAGDENTDPMHRLMDSPVRDFNYSPEDLTLQVMMSPSTDDDPFHIDPKAVELFSALSPVKRAPAPEFNYTTQLLFDDAVEPPASDANEPCFQPSPRLQPVFVERVLETVEEVVQTTYEEVVETIVVEERQFNETLIQQASSRDNTLVNENDVDCEMEVEHSLETAIESEDDVQNNDQVQHREVAGMDFDSVNVDYPPSDKGIQNLTVTLENAVDVVAENPADIVAQDVDMEAEASKSDELDASKQSDVSMNESRVPESTEAEDPQRLAAQLLSESSCRRRASIGMKMEKQKRRRSSLNQAAASYPSPDYGLDAVATPSRLFDDTVTLAPAASPRHAIVPEVLPTPVRPPPLSFMSYCRTPGLPPVAETPRLHAAASYAKGIATPGRGQVSVIESCEKPPLPAHAAAIIEQAKELLVKPFPDVKDLLVAMPEFEDDSQTVQIHVPKTPKAHNERTVSLSSFGAVEYTLTTTEFILFERFVAAINAVLKLAAPFSDRLQTVLGLLNGVEPATMILEAPIRVATIRYAAHLLCMEHVLSRLQSGSLEDSEEQEAAHDLRQKTDEVAQVLVELKAEMSRRFDVEAFQNNVEEAAFKMYKSDRAGFDAIQEATKTATIVNEDIKTQLHETKTHLRQECEAMHRSLIEDSTHLHNVISAAVDELAHDFDL